jgi:hypothetical protein
MRYALLLYAAPESAERPGPSANGVFDTWTGYTRALSEAGVLLGAEQLHGTDCSTTVRLSDGERMLTDGPFIETKEHLLGFYLLDVPDLDAALEWAGRIPLVRYGSVEVRPVMEAMPWRAARE